MIPELPASRSEAQRLGVNRFYIGVPCSRGHNAPRYVSTTNCVECQVEHARRNGGWKARPSPAQFLRLIAELVEKKGGTLISIEYVSAKSKLDVRCGRGHQFAASADNLKRGKWCPIGLELLDQEYKGAGYKYSWRCTSSGHVISRAKGNIEQSLNKGYSACNRCGPGTSANVRARQRRADVFASTVFKAIESLKSAGNTSLEGIARELNARGTPTARGAKWYASTVKNLIARANRPDVRDVDGAR